MKDPGDEDVQAYWCEWSTKRREAQGRLDDNWRAGAAQAWRSWRNLAKYQDWLADEAEAYL